MDRAIYADRINELIGRLVQELPKEIDRLTRSGGIDIAGAEDDYVAPKVVFKVALENYAAMVALPDRGAADVRNLRHF